MSTPQITKFNLTSGWFSSKYPNHLGKSRKIPNHQIIWLEYHSFWAQWPSRVPGRLPGVSLQGLGAWGYGKNQEITSKTWISIRAIHDSCLKCFPKFPSSSIFASKHAALVTWLTTQAAPPLFHGGISSNQPWHSSKFGKAVADQNPRRSEKLPRLSCSLVPYVPVGIMPHQQGPSIKSRLEINWSRLPVKSPWVFRFLNPSWCCSNH